MNGAIGSDENTSSFALRSKTLNTSLLVPCRLSVCAYAFFLQIFLHLPACSLSSMSSPAHILIFHLPANQPLDHPRPPPPAPPTGTALCPAFTFPCAQSSQTSPCHHSSVPESVCCVQVRLLEVSNLHYVNLKVHCFI